MRRNPRCLWGSKTVGFRCSDWCASPWDSSNFILFHLHRISIWWFPKIRLTPSHHPFVDGISPNKDHPAIGGFPMGFLWFSYGLGYPHDHGNHWKPPDLAISASAASGDPPLELSFIMEDGVIFEWPGAGWQASDSEIHPWWFSKETYQINIYLYIVIYIYTHYTIYCSNLFMVFLLFQFIQLWIYVWLSDLPKYQNCGQRHLVWITWNWVTRCEYQL